jgi:hypothetical protein
LNSAFEDVRQKFLDVRTHGRRAARDGDVAEEGGLPRRNLIFLRHTYTPHGASGTRDADCSEHRFPVTHALEHRVCAEPIRELLDSLHGRFAALAHDIRGAEFARE